MKKIKLTDKQKFDMAVRMAKKLVKEFNEIHRKELIKIDHDKDSILERSEYVNLLMNVLNKFVGSIFLDLRSFIKEQSNQDIDVLGLLTLFHTGLYCDVEKYLSKEKFN